MSVTSLDHMPKLDALLYGRPAGRNIIDYACEEIKRTRQNNWNLCTAVREYHAVLNEIHTFISAYLEGGGDPTEMPPRWHDLDKLRQVKYANLLQLTGLTS